MPFLLFRQSNNMRLKILLLILFLVSLFSIVWHLKVYIDIENDKIQRLIDDNNTAIYQSISNNTDLINNLCNQLKKE